MYLYLENDIGQNREMPDLSSRSARSLSVIWHFSIFLSGLKDNVNVIFLFICDIAFHFFVVYKIFFLPLLRFLRSVKHGSTVRKSHDILEGVY